MKERIEELYELAGQKKHWKSVRLAAAILEKEVDTLAPAITSMQRGGIVYNPVTSVMCVIKKNFATELDIGWILVLLGISLMKIVIEEPCLGGRNSVNDTLYRFPVSVGKGIIKKTAN